MAGWERWHRCLSSHVSHLLGSKQIPKITFQKKGILVCGINATCWIKSSLPESSPAVLMAKRWVLKMLRINMKPMFPFLYCVLSGHVTFSLFCIETPIHVALRDGFIHCTSAFFCLMVLTYSVSSWNTCVSRSCWPYLVYGDGPSWTRWWGGGGGNQMGKTD